MHFVTYNHPISFILLFVSFVSLEDYGRMTCPHLRKEGNLKGLVTRWIGLASSGHACQHRCTWTTCTCMFRSDWSVRLYKCYRIAGNFWGRKLSWISRKGSAFFREEFRGRVNWSHRWVWHTLKFCGENFTGGCKIMKFVKQSERTRKWITHAEVTFTLWGFCTGEFQHGGQNSWSTAVDAMCQ